MEEVLDLKTSHKVIVLKSSTDKMHNNKHNTGTLVDQRVAALKNRVAQWASISGIFISSS